MSMLAAAILAFWAFNTWASISHLDKLKKESDLSWLDKTLNRSNMIGCHDQTKQSFERQAELDYLSWWLRYHYCEAIAQVVLFLCLLTWLICLALW